MFGRRICGMGVATYVRRGTVAERGVVWGRSLARWNVAAPAVPMALAADRALLMREAIRHGIGPAHWPAS